MNQDLIEKIVAIPQINFFFENYEQEDWPELILNLTLYSIYALRSYHQGPPSLSYLQDLTRKAGMIISLEQAFPSLQEKLSTIKENIIRIESDLQTNRDEKIMTGLTDNPKFKPKIRYSSVPSKDLSNQNWGIWRNGDSNIFAENNPENKLTETKFTLFKDAPPPSSKSYKFEENSGNVKLNENDTIKSIYPLWWPKQASIDEENRERSSKSVQKKLSQSKKSKFVNTENCGNKNSSIIWKQKSRKKLTSQTKDGKLRSNKRIEHADKSTGADLKSPQSSFQENRVHFDSKSQKNPKQASLKRHPAWAKDFSDVVKRSPSASIREYPSPLDSRQNSPSSHHNTNLFSPEAPNSPFLQESQELKSFNQYVSSELTDYTPNNEMKAFYQNQYGDIFGSRGTDYIERGLKSHENSYHSYSREVDSLRGERSGSSFNSHSKTAPMHRIY